MPRFGIENNRPTIIFEFTNIHEFVEQNPML